MRNFISTLKNPSRLGTRNFCYGSFKIEKIGVIGLGLMGHGIAQAIASEVGQKYQVVGLESNANALEAGRKRIEGSLQKIYSKNVLRGKISESDSEQEKLEILSRIRFTSDETSLHDCDLIIEAITEDPRIKVPLYERLGKISKPNCVLASNTSSLKITDLARASGSPQRVIGLHFFNPVQVMKLVEVIRTDETDENVYEAGKHFTTSIGKHPVCCKDTPGFIVNRLLVPALTQAILMYERGDASIEDIDKSMELGAGHPMGPLKLADYIGLDTCLYILEGWVEKYPSESAFMVPKILAEMVKNGKLGRKSGEGFFKWEGDKIVK